MSPLIQHNGPRLSNTFIIKNISIVTKYYPSIVPYRAHLYKLNPTSVPTTNAKKAIIFLTYSFLFPSFSKRINKSSIAIPKFLAISNAYCRLESYLLFSIALIVCPLTLHNSANLPCEKLFISLYSLILFSIVYAPHCKE